MLSLKSPAKVNLFLKVTGKRVDGYHNIASLFQAIDLCDQLTVKISDQDRLTCSRSDLSTGHDNLISKAVELFRQKTNISFHADIHLEKNIPMEAGLGGGSGNAATTLWALNELLGNPVDEHLLVKWSQEIGSDIPFFFSSGTAYCTGRGGNVLSLPPLPNQTLHLYHPGYGLSTKDVYQAMPKNNPSTKNPLDCLAQFLQGTPILFNDLEAPAFQIKPELAAFKKQLSNQTILMSGSGTCFFSFGEKEEIPSYMTSVQYLNRVDHHWY